MLKLREVSIKKGPVARSPVKPVEPLACGATRVSELEDLEGSSHDAASLPDRDRRQGREAA